MSTCLLMPVLLGVEGAETSVLSTVFLRFLAASPTSLSEVVATAGSMGYIFGLRGSREAVVQAEALEAKALMCLRRLTGPEGSDPHGVVSSSSGRERPR